MTTAIDEYKIVYRSIGFITFSGWSKLDPKEPKGTFFCMKRVVESSF